MPYKDPERGKAYLREYGKKWRPAHPGYWRKHNWRKRGLDPIEAGKLYDSIDNCAVCNSEVTGSNKHIDHDHRSALPRGVLCKKCNLAIGLMREDSAILKKAISYLRNEGSRN